MKDYQPVKVSSRKLWGTFIFSLAMAYVEATAVVYLRRIIGIDIFMINPGLFDAQIVTIELGRELATLIMLFTVGWVAGRNFQSRFGFSIFCFGAWDIFYYAWLKLFVGWPVTLLDNDLLFLIPLPWWGPVLSPVLIAALMCAVGVRMVILDNREEKFQINSMQWIALAVGILLVLFVFMADAIAVLPANAQSLSQLQPGMFMWPIFLIGLSLGIYAVWQILFLKREK
jgi:hypothetical protein